MNTKTITLQHTEFISPYDLNVNDIVSIQGAFSQQSVAEGRVVSIHRVQNKDRWIFTVEDHEYGQVHIFGEDIESVVRFVDTEVEVD